MGIAPATSQEFFEKAKKKLPASTRAQAIAIAVSLGIVAP
jgi:DNA-binding CsgD family transcriptional regulator